MKSPWEVRFKSALKTLGRYARNQNRPVSGSQAEIIRRQVFSDLNLQPSTDDFSVQPFERMDITRFIAYLYAMETDVNFIATALDELEFVLDNLEVTEQLESVALRQTESSGLRALAVLQSSGFIEGVTRELKIPDDIGVLGSTVAVGDGSISLPNLSSVLNNGSAYTDADVEVTVIEQTTMIDNFITGDRPSVLTNSFKRGMALEVRARKVEQVRVLYRVKGRWPVSNKITIELNPSSVGTRVEVSIISKLGQPEVKVYEGVVNSEQVQFEIEESEIAQLLIRMGKNFPDVKLPAYLQYFFWLEKVRAENTKVARQGTFTSEPIEVPEGTQFVALVTEQLIPPGSTVDYFIGPSVKADDEPTTWFPVIPTNQDPPVDVSGSIEDLPGNRFVAMNVGQFTIELTRETEWLLDLIPGFRNDMYNILQDTNYDDERFSIENGVLIVKDPNAIQILQDTVSLQNGKNDWAVVREVPVTENQIQRLALAAEVNTSTRWYDPMPVLDSHVFGFRPGSPTNTISTPYIPIGADNVKIETEDGKVLAIVVNSMTSNSIVINRTLDAEKLYRVTFSTPMRSDSEVVDGTLVLEQDGRQLVVERDWIYSPETREIVFLRQGSFSTNGSLVIQSYLKKTTATSEIISYRTWLNVKSRTEITISPFTSIEYTKGNFHKIDGKDVSLVSSYILEPGIHEIETTQPEPTSLLNGSDSDVNYFTGERSDAGIVLTDMEHYAFRPLMRRVGLADLEFNVPRESHANYAFTDGKLLMNKKPAFISQVFLDDPATTSTIGEYLRGKSITTPTPNTKRFVTLPEKFLFSFRYQTLTANRYIRIRAVISRGSSVNPRITRIGITPITGST